MDPVKMEPIGCIDKFHRRGGLSDIPDNAHMQICNLCGSCEGLTLACSHPGCRFTFHPICGKQAAFYMEIEASGNAQQVAMIAYCKHHTMRLRTDKLTGRDMEVWIPDKEVWAKARIGFYFPAEKKHRIVYHIDGVVEEMVDLRALLRRGKKASSPPKLEFYENGYMIPTVRLLNEPYARRPDETKDSKCPPALKVCVQIDQTRAISTFQKSVGFAGTVMVTTQYFDSNVKSVAWTREIGKTLSSVKTKHWREH